jgi:hypothetical protein
MRLPANVWYTLVLGVGGLCQGQQQGLPEKSLWCSQLAQYTQLSLSKFPSPLQRISSANWWWSNYQGNSIELSPSWEATSRSATQEFSSILWNVKDHCCDHKSSTLTSILRHSNPVLTTPSSFSKIQFYMCSIIWNKTWNTRQTVPSYFSGANLVRLSGWFVEMYMSSFLGCWHHAVTGWLAILRTVTLWFSSHMFITKQWDCEKLRICQSLCCEIGDCSETLAHMTTTIQCYPNAVAVLKFPL